MSADAGGLPIAKIGDVYLNLSAVVCAEWQFATDERGNRQLHFFAYLLPNRHYKFAADRGGRELEALLKARTINGTQEN